MRRIRFIYTLTVANCSVGDRRVISWRPSAEWMAVAKQSKVKGSCTIRTMLLHRKSSILAS